MLFCNSCNLLGIWVDRKDVLSEKVLKVLKEVIGKLVGVAKDKVGNWRKSSAILLGKSSGDAGCRS